MSLVDCACGCKRQLESKDSRGRPRRFIWGHHIRFTPAMMDKGRTPWNKGINTGHTPWNKGKKWPEMSGANNPAWRGGTSFKRGSRWKTEYKQWRKAVFRRDNYTCVECKEIEPKPIHADHIKSWSEYPDLRFEISNGRTLCWPCHKKTDTYGYRKKQTS